MEMIGRSMRPAPADGITWLVLYRWRQASRCLYRHSCGAIPFLTRVVCIGCAIAPVFLRGLRTRRRGDTLCVGAYLHSALSFNDRLTTTSDMTYLRVKTIFYIGSIAPSSSLDSYKGRSFQSKGSCQRSSQPGQVRSTATNIKKQKSQPSTVESFHPTEMIICYYFIILVFFKKSS